MGFFSNLTFSKQKFRFSSAINSESILAKQDISTLFLESYYFPYVFKLPLISYNLRVFLHTFSVFLFPFALTMMHLCITQWTPLTAGPEYGGYYTVTYAQL